MTTLLPPEGTTELGIDIIKVDRIRDVLERHGERFTRRVLTDEEQGYVRDRPETMAGRWAAKEAVSKVLGLGVRGVGWREIEIVRLPTGQPNVRLHDRARVRADQLGMERIAVSISHEREYAVAVAFGIRTLGGAFVFPLDVDARLEDREQRVLGRIERLRALEREARAAEEGARASGVGSATAATPDPGQGPAATPDPGQRPAGTPDPGQPPAATPDPGQPPAATPDPGQRPAATPGEAETP